MSALLLRLPPAAIAAGFVLLGIAAWLTVRTLPAGQVPAPAGLRFWAIVISLWAVAWALNTALCAADARTPIIGHLRDLAVPAVFGATLLFLWEALVQGLGIPLVLLPAPSDIWAKLMTSGPTLWSDFVQTFLRAVIPGWILGSLAGFLTAIVCDRIPFLKRGLLPLGSLIAALPIVGIAPIMVMWFGFDWQSKAAVVVIMTFFPMLVNTLAGLEAAGRLERDLMRSYG
ncbi:MAG: ABC transporter permease, partial [Pseudomonadota bacterium]|nr:ABC transporter permease [Pseudomonadota bacterium]